MATPATSKVGAKPIAKPATNNRNLAQTNATSAPEFNFKAAVQELNKDHKTAYMNFKADLESGKITKEECPRIVGYKVPFCKDEYVFYPGDLSYKRVSEHLGLEKGELGRLGLLKGVGGNPDLAKPYIPMAFSKEYLDGVMEQHRIIAGIPKED